MAEVIGEFSIQGRTYIREETGRFMSAVQKGAVEAVAELTDTMADLVRAAIAASFKVRTGELKGSVRPVHAGAQQGQVIVEADHSAPLHEGAVAHWIPNAFGRGTPVWHPGNHPNPFVREAERAITVLSREIVRRNMPGA